MHYIAKKPFSFNGHYYKAGDTFSQIQTKATDAKMRALVSGRYVALADMAEMQHVKKELVAQPPVEAPIEEVAEEAVSEPQAVSEEVSSAVDYVEPVTEAPKPVVGRRTAGRRRP